MPGNSLRWCDQPLVSPCSHGPHLSISIFGLLSYDHLLLCGKILHWHPLLVATIVSIVISSPFPAYGPLLLPLPVIPSNLGPPLLDSSHPLDGLGTLLLLVPPFSCVSLPKYTLGPHKMLL